MGSLPMRLVCLLLCCLLLTGCAQNVVQEDRYQDALPDIDTEAGVAKDREVTLYYRLADEPALVPVVQTISVRSSEYAEFAVLRKLLEGLQSAIPEGTRLVSAYRDGSILYVTLSREFIDNAGQQNDQEERQIARRLSVYAVVNSLCGIPNASFSTVQIRVDLNGTGEGVGVSPSLLGFSDVGVGTQWLEPMGFEQSVVVTPQLTAELLLAHLAADEYAAAYPLFAESETGGLQKPDYATVETQMKTLGTIDDFTIRSAQEEENGRSAEVRADIAWTPRGEAQRTVENVSIQMLREGEIYKMGYRSLLSALQAEG